MCCRKNVYYLMFKSINYCNGIDNLNETLSDITQFTLNYE